MNTYEHFNALIQSILENTNIASMLIDETGEILYINHRAKNIIGFDETIKYSQDYLTSDCWQELNKLLKSKTEASSENSYYAFKMQFKTGPGFSVNLSIKEISIDDKRNYLIKIIPFQATIASDSLKNISILPANFNDNKFESKLVKIIEEFTSHYPPTFIQKELIEKQTDQLDELFWIKDNDGNYIVVNNKLCELLGLQKFQLEGKSYKEFIPGHLNKFFDAVEKYQLELKNPIAIKGISLFNFSLSEGKEIVEIPVLDNDRKIIALVGFSRDIPSTLPINKNKIAEEILGKFISFLPTPVVVIENSSKIKLCNQEFCKLINKNLEDILNSDLIELLPHGLSDAISNFARKCFRWHNN